jgi:hypothetical protein
MCVEASSILGAVAADFLCNCWCLEIPSDITVLGTYQGASTIMRKAFCWIRSRISMLDLKQMTEECDL